MKHFSGIIITVLVITISCSNTGENEHQISQVELNDYMDTVSYSVGIDIGKSFRYQEMDIDPIVLAKGLDDAFNEKEIKLTEEEVQLTLVKFRQEFQQKQREIAQRKAQEAAAARRRVPARAMTARATVLTKRPPSRRGRTPNGLEPASSARTPTRRRRPTASTTPARGTGAW